METIAKIRAEIERRIKLYSVTNEKEQWIVNTYWSVLSFLSTLESEKPMNQEGLEEEYKDYVESDPVYSKLVNRNAGLSIARHFAQWQKDKDTRDMYMSDNRHFQKVYELGRKDEREQMMKEAVVYVAEPETPIGNILIPFIRIDRSVLFQYGIKVGDKVRLIICKKED